MLIDTGMPIVYKRLAEYISGFDIRYIFLTHAHVDHDGSAERLRRETGAEIILGERDRELIGHYGRQPVRATSSRYRLRNIQQNICGRMKLSAPVPMFPISLWEAVTGISSRSWALMRRQFLCPGIPSALWECSRRECYTAATLSRQCGESPI